MYLFRLHKWNLCFNLSESWVSKSWYRGLSRTDTWIWIAVKYSGRLTSFIRESGVGSLCCHEMLHLFPTNLQRHSGVVSLGTTSGNNSTNSSSHLRDRPQVQPFLDCQFYSASGKNKLESGWSLSYAVLTNKKNKDQKTTFSGQSGG